MDNLRNNIDKFAGERLNLALTIGFIAMYEENLDKYGPRGSNAEKYGQNEDKDGQDE